MMMIMEGSKLFKTEYDFKAIIYSAYNIPHKVHNISGNQTIQQLKIPPNNAGRPIRQFKWPLAWIEQRSLSQIIATMISTVKCERNNLPFTIKDILKGEFNWNMYEITPPCYAINTCILYRLRFKQHGFLTEGLIGYTHANFRHATTFGCRNIAFQIWWLPCNPHRRRWPKTFLWAVYTWRLLSNCSSWALLSSAPQWLMMTSSIGNIFRVTGPLRGEFTGHRWILLTKASDADWTLTFSFICALNKRLSKQ